jgi:hypothetical protein
MANQTWPLEGRALRDPVWQAGQPEIRESKMVRPVRAEGSVELANRAAALGLRASQPVPGEERVVHHPL